MRTIGLVALVALLVCGVVDAQEWPRFRGHDVGVAPDDPALPDRWSLLAPRSRWRAAIVPKAASDAARADAEAGVSRRWPWARLLQRVFGFEVLVCDRCGGPPRILGAVTEPHAVRRLLVALGLAAKPPPAPLVPAA